MTSDADLDVPLPCRSDYADAPQVSAGKSPLIPFPVKGAFICVIIIMPPPHRAEALSDAFV